MSNNSDLKMKIDISYRELRLLLFHEFRLGRKATEAARNIRSTMGKDVISIRTAQLSFNKFKNGNFELDQLARSGRPLKVDLNSLKKLIEEDPRLTTRFLGELIKCSHTTVLKHLKVLQKTWKYGVFVPHQLSPFQLQQRVNTCMELLTSHRNHEWLHNLITGDEKWVLYVNHTRRKQWLGTGQRGIETPKTELHPKKVMLSIWWNVRGIIHWELLPTGSTVTTNIYCQQLNRVQRKLNGRQSKVYYLHDNARPHISKSTNKKLVELGWTVLPHPPYSPDFAPTDYHLFLSISNHLQEKEFDEERELKKFLQDFFSSKSQEFYANGILSLPKRWQQVVDNNGAYIIRT